MPDARKVITLRLADDEVATWEALASKAGQNRADYFRSWLRTAATGQRAPQRRHVAPQRPARANEASAAAGRRGPGWCPRCGGLTVAQGHGQQACSLCDWKGKV